MIEDYFLEIERNISCFDYIEKQQIEKQKIDDSFGIIKGLLFIEGCKLEFIEVVRIIFGVNNKIKYKYHFMTTNNTLIFRYDNAKHHKDLATYPHHKHMNSVVIPSEEPDMLIILKEIKDYCNNTLNKNINP